MSYVICLLASVLAATFGSPWKPQDDFRPNAAARMPSAEAARFLKAAPVWLAGQESAENALFGFRADFVAGKGDRPVLRIAATTFYRVYVNGVFVGHGPVRAAHGFFRTDEWPLDAVVREGTNAVAVDVRRYGVRTQNCAGLQPGFLLAEVASGERVLAATGRDFTCVRLPLLPNAERFTPQRAPIEVYRLASDWRDYRTRPGFRGAPPARRPDVKLLPRLSPYPGFDVVRPRAYAASAFSYDAAAPRKRPELCLDGREELGRVGNVTVAPSGASGAAGVGRGTLADFGRVDSGFLGLTLTCKSPCRVMVVFDEDLKDGWVNPVGRYGHPTCACFELTEAGRYPVELLEPTALRYVHVYATSGEAEVSDVFLREYKNPRVFAAAFECSDDRLNRVFAAARDTCSQNTMDGQLDCPTRERNSAPCEAYFNLGACVLLSGAWEIERLFFDNFALVDEYPDVPKPMIPWCYPTDYPDPKSVFIQYCMTWFPMELRRYAFQTGDDSYAGRLREKLLALVPFYRKSYNADGLQENPEGWIFLDWSRANDFTRDVNYPLNMNLTTYYEELDRLYGLPGLKAEAARMRETIRRQSWNGTWFRDHARRQSDGSLKVAGDISEACQYYALFYGLASPTAPAGYWDRVRKELGRGRCPKGLHPSDYWLGMIMRHCLLVEWGHDREAAAELAELVDMADRTGTLWECFPGNSLFTCCHGFGSYSAVLLVKAALGLREIDYRGRRVRFAVPDNGLDFCRATLPTPDGPIRCEWSRTNGRVSERLDLPAGWRTSDRKR